MFFEVEGPGVETPAEARCGEGARRHDFGPADAEGVGGELHDDGADG